MSEEIALRFTYGEGEFVAAMRTYYWRTPSTWAKLVLAYILVMVVGAIGWWLRGSSTVWAAMAIGPPFAIAYFIFALGYRIPKKQFQKLPAFHSEVIFRFTEDDIESKTKYEDSKLAWEMFTRVWITRELYILVQQGGAQFLAVPRRIFEDAQQEWRFVDLLKRKVAAALA